MGAWSPSVPQLAKHPWSYPNDTGRTNSASERGRLLQCFLCGIPLQHPRGMKTPHSLSRPLGWSHGLSQSQQFMLFWSPFLTSNLSLSGFLSLFLMERKVGPPASCSVGGLSQEPLKCSRPHSQHCKPLASSLPACCSLLVTMAS